MRTTIPKPADRDEWLAARAPYIGASEAAALVGEHPFLTHAELAVEKLSGSPGTRPTAMRRGRHLEHAVARWWEEEHGIALLEPDELYVYDDALIATLDRLVVGAPVAIEIKTTNRYIDELERSWYWQAQVQALCADLEHVEIVVLDPTMELKRFFVEPDDEDQALVLEAAEKFLHHVRAGELPPDVELTYRAAAALHPEPVVQSTELDDEALRWCRSLASLQERIKSLQADEDQLKGMIAHRLGDAAEGHHDGPLVCTWRRITRTTSTPSDSGPSTPSIAKECTTDEHVPTAPARRPEGEAMTTDRTMPLSFQSARERKQATPSFSTSSCSATSPITNPSARTCACPSPGTADRRRRTSGTRCTASARRKRLRSANSKPTTDRETTRPRRGRPVTALGDLVHGGPGPAGSPAPRAARSSPRTRRRNDTSTNYTPAGGSSAGNRHTYTAQSTDDDKAATDDHHDHDTLTIGGPR